jgi:hypothetical protein
MREWCAPGVRPGRGKGPAVRCQRSVLVTRTVVAGMRLTASVPLLESARRALDSLVASAGRFIGARRCDSRPHPLTAGGSEPRRALPGWVTSIATVSCPS